MKGVDEKVPRKAKEIRCSNIFKDRKDRGDGKTYTSLWMEYINRMEENKRMDLRQPEEKVMEQSSPEGGYCLERPSFSEEGYCLERPSFSEGRHCLEKPVFPDGEHRSDEQDLPGG